MTDWAALESPLVEAPAFYVEAPDGKRDWSEDDRCKQFLALMRNVAPRVLVFHVANEGKRNPAQASKLGIMGGVFDYAVHWRDGLTAYCEFKGYCRRRVGSLSPAQVSFGNRCVELGIPAACFFDPVAAVRWLAAQGFPVREFVA